MAKIETKEVGKTGAEKLIWSVWRGGECKRGRGAQKTVGQRGKTEQKIKAPGRVKGQTRDEREEVLKVQEEEGKTIIAVTADREK